MFIHKKRLCALLACVFCLCAMQGALAAKGVSKIRLSASKLSLDVGVTEQLTVSAKPEGANFTVKWKSSKPGVAEVDEDGYVTAVGKGRAVITAKTKNGKTAKCKVTVADPNRILALTFDDGPNQNTASILETLDKYGAKATFFMLGIQAEKFPEVAKQIAQSGCEIGNHTLGHKSLRKLTLEEAAQELQAGAQAIEAASGQAPTLIRAPYGHVPDGLPALMDMPFVQWNVDPEDWKSKNARSVYDLVLANVKPGCVVLMHDIYASTGEAVQKIVPELKRQGYKLVTVSELMQNTNFDQTKVIITP